MRVAFFIAMMVLPLTSIAQTDEQRFLHQQCSEHRAKITINGGMHGARSMPAPGFEPGWEKCEASEAAYRDAAIKAGPILPVPADDGAAAKARQLLNAPPR